MKAMSNRSIVHIVTRTLNHVDERLMGHGERVAYIFYYLLKEKGLLDDAEMIKLAMLGLLHDVGAYKTEDIDQMVEFETNTIWEHSIYGALFLQCFSPLKNYADVVLYHHLPYHHFDQVSFEHKDYAALLHLADRIDIVFSNTNSEKCHAYVKKQAGNQFCPLWVKTFLAADQKYHILDRLADGSHVQEFDKLLEETTFTPEQQHQFLRLIAYSIDFRSEHMVLHTVTTVTVSQTICEMMRLCEEERSHVYYGALLHDVGKVSTPIEILEKPGKLTPEETAIMRHHVAVTGEILGDIVDDNIRNIAVRHHEKIDGSGYPLGLVGSQLSVGDRIVAIADIISALIRKRSYKQAFDKSVTMEILSEMMENHKICPVITKKVLDNFDSILKNSEQSGKEILDMYNNIKDQYQSILSRVPRELGGNPHKQG